MRRYGWAKLLNGSPLEVNFGLFKMKRIKGELACAREYASEPQTTYTSPTQFLHPKAPITLFLLIALIL